MSGELNIEVLYSCPACVLKDAVVTVPARVAEDVCDWMEQTIRLTGADHAARSPDCHPDTLHDLKIPMPPKSDRVGGLPLN